MDNLIIPIHSSSDVITNSSSELFMCCVDDGVEIAKEAIREIMKAVDVEDAIEGYFDIYMWVEEDEDFEEDFMDRDWAHYGITDEQAREMVKNKDPKFLKYCNFEEFPNRKQLCIVPKNDKAKNIFATIKKLFEMENCLC